MGIFLKGSAVESILYISTLFNETNFDVSFRVPDDGQHDFLYRLIHPESFVYRRVCFHFMDCLFDSVL